MVGKAQAQSIAQRLRPYNAALTAAGFVVDGCVGAWLYLDGHIPMDPILYGAVSGLLKSLSMAIHFLSTKISEEPADGSDANASPGQ